jgi:hypothetical protein
VSFAVVEYIQPWGDGHAWEVQRGGSGCEISALAQ